MPELPEVEVVRRGLDAHVVGSVLESVTLTGHRVARRHLAGPDDLAARLTGRLVVGARRRGKYLWLDLAPARTSAAPDEALVVHLGMSGQMLVVSDGAPAVRHQHGTFSLGPPEPVGPEPAGMPPTADGSASDVVDAPARVVGIDGRRELRFVDQRTFGGLALAPLVPDPADPSGQATVPEPVAHIAPDPFDATFDPQSVARAMKRRDSAVKRALLDQSLVSGVGNIYADEALWSAQVHGERLCSALTKPTLLRVLCEARTVMERALEAGGTSFDALYVDVDGRSGYFERSLHAYGRAGQPCARCESPIRRESFMNRSSFSCPRCQPRPRNVSVRPG